MTAGAPRASVPAPDPEWLRDVATRAASVDWSLLTRVATCVEPVAGGVAVRLASVPRSRHHNRLLCDQAVDAATVAAEADRVQGDLPYRRVLLLGDACPAAIGLAERGWQTERLLTMAARPRYTDAGAARVVPAQQVRAFLETSWRQALPDPDDETIRQLIDRFEVEESVVDVLRLAVLVGDQVVASALLKVDGRTAVFDALETDPAFRGRGYGDDLLALASDIAARRGCDLLVLIALAADWPAQWYARRGFGVVDEQFDCAIEPP